MVDGQGDVFGQKKGWVGVPSVFRKAPPGGLGSRTRPRLLAGGGDGGGSTEGTKPMLLPVVAEKK